MKKIICICVICILLMTSIVGCQKQEMNVKESQSVVTSVEETESASSSVEETESVLSSVEELQEDNETESEVETVEVTSEPESTEVTVKEQEESTESLNVDIDNLNEERSNMYYVMDALADQCYYEAYNPSDAYFFWGALSTFISFNPERWADETTEMGWRVERSRVEQYAAGLFEKYNGLMDIPENSYMVQMQDGNNYEIMAGDRGMEYTKITSWIVENDGMEKVTMDLIDEMENEPFATYVFTLVENPQFKTNNNQIFVYSVKSVEKID